MTPIPPEHHRYVVVVNDRPPFGLADYGGKRRMTRWFQSREAAQAMADELNGVNDDDNQPHP